LDHLSPLWDKGDRIVSHFKNSRFMKALSLPIVEVKFVEKLGKTAITVRNNNSLLTVWANGDQTGTNALIANIVVNEIGDTFVATSDSKTMNEKGEPVFLKGAIVTRQKQTEEFKSFAGNNTAAQFAQAASVFGLQLNVVMTA